MKQILLQVYNTPDIRHSELADKVGIALNYLFELRAVAINEKNYCNQKKDMLIFLHQKIDSKCVERDSYYEKRQEYGVTD